jgi:hypothetical protein
MERLKERFKSKPQLYYTLSIAASWAGAGSLMNSTTLANTLGVIPAAIWCVFNTLACIVFGLIIWYMPTVRKVMKTKLCRLILAAFSIFQIWLCMTALHDAWEGITGNFWAMMITYGFTIGFVLVLLTRGIVANILTDNGGMWIIYALVLILSVVSLIATQGDFNKLSLGLNAGALGQGFYKGFLLLPGPFTYPYFFKLVDYNEKNDEKVSQCDITRAFIGGGIAFGIYLVFAFSLIFTSISPVLEVAKAILLSALAVSSLSSFIYSEYAVFGSTLGFLINGIATAFWIFVAPLGVMGVWTLMAESRIYLICGMLAVALGMKLADHGKAVSA